MEEGEGSNTIYCKKNPLFGGEGVWITLGGERVWIASICNVQKSNNFAKCGLLSAVVFKPILMHEVLKGFKICTRPQNTFMF